MNLPKKHNMKLKQGYRFGVAVVAVAVLSSCDHNRNTPGWQYFDDMVKSPAYETYTANPNFADGKTMQPPVEGTVARGEMPYPYIKSDEDRAKAGQTLVNPMEATSENIERGHEVFKIYCMNCHGEAGDGKGFLFTSKKYPYPPGNLLSPKMRAAPEGEIFHVISVGWGVMGEHGSMLKPHDRWNVAMYIRNVLQKSPADQSAVKPALPAATASN